MIVPSGNWKIIASCLGTQDMHHDLTRLQRATGELSWGRIEGQSFKEPSTTSRKMDVDNGTYTRHPPESLKTEVKSLLALHLSILLPPTTFVSPILPSLRQRRCSRHKIADLLRQVLGLVDILGKGSMASEQVGWSLRHAVTLHPIAIAMSRKNTSSCS